jgi:energy-coupling factor transporter ATP-binding protein EcfA2
MCAKRAHAATARVVMITHKFREVMAFADDVTVLRRGRLVHQLRGGRHRHRPCWPGWWARPPPARAEPRPKRCNAPAQRRRHPWLVNGLKVTATAASGRQA